MNLNPIQEAATNATEARPERRGALLPRLRAGRPAMTKVDQAIAEYVLGNPDEIVTIAIADLAAACGVSVGSIVGFCQRLGFTGFSDFKISLAREFVESGLPAGRRESASVLESVLEFHRQAFSETLALNPLETFDAAVDVLRRAARIELYSVGVSYPVAETAASKLTSIGFRANAAQNTHAQFVTASQLGPRDVAFAISLTGEAPETLRSIEIAKAQGAATLCITNSIGSPVAKACDLHLYAAPTELLPIQAPLPSLVTEMALVDALFVSLVRRQGRKAAEYLQRSSEYLLEWFSSHR